MELSGASGCGNGRGHLFQLNGDTLSGSRAGKLGLKIYSEGWGEVLFVPAFSIGCKAVFSCFSLSGILIVYYVLLDAAGQYRMVLSGGSGYMV